MKLGLPHRLVLVTGLLVTVAVPLVHSAVRAATESNGQVTRTTPSTYDNPFVSLQPGPAIRARSPDVAQPDASTDSQPPEPSAADLADQAVHSNNEAALRANLALYRSNAEAVRERLARIAVNEAEPQRARVMAACLLVSIDEPVLSPGTIEVLRVHLTCDEEELRRQAVLRLPESLGPTPVLVPALTRIATAKPSETCIGAADVLARWGAIGRDDLIRCLTRGLEAEDHFTVDRVLEIPLLPTLASDRLSSLLVGLLGDDGQSLALAGQDSPFMEGFERRHAAMVVISRLPQSTRHGIRRSFDVSTPVSAEDEPLLRLCLEGPASLTLEETLTLLKVKSTSRTWSVLRILIDQNAITGPLRLPAAQLAFQVSHRDGIFRMLGRWIQGLSEEEVRELVAADETDYFRWRMEQVRGLEFEPER